MTKTTYLVTGGAGFIGSNITAKLVSEGHNVRVLDNLATGRESNLSGLIDKIDFIKGDIRDLAACKKAAEGVDGVLHLAALPSVPRSVQDPVTSNDVNVNGTLNMLVAARDAKVRRFVFSSSSSVYGDTPGLPRREDMKPSPLSPYALQKLTGEYYCKVFHGLYGLGTVVLRYFNVFGPNQDPKSQYAAVIPKFIAALKSGVAPVIYGDGGQTRDFTFVADVVKANILASRCPDSAVGMVYNVARGDRVSLNQMLGMLKEIMKSNITPEYQPSRAGDVRDSQADSSLAQKNLGWSPDVVFRQGLEKTVSYFLK
jgi:nucleoside-diphosphate-sugar epimerase